MEGGCGLIGETIIASEHVGPAVIQDRPTSCCRSLQRIPNTSRSAECCSLFFWLIDGATRVSSFDKVCKNWWNTWNMAESRLPDVEILPWHKDLEIVNRVRVIVIVGRGERGNGRLAVSARICRKVYSVDDSTSYVPQPYALSNVFRVLLKS
jgi:hypothetical protein